MWRSLVARLGTAVAIVMLGTVVVAISCGLGVVFIAVVRALN